MNTSTDRKKYSACKVPSVTIQKVMPILRIFDYQKAVEFYVDWLGFTIEWEHVLEEGMPKYMEIIREDLTLHLSEHHGDATPGVRVFLWAQV
jgi:catechol 2,3-dioxygenase-like lactoylglutathione lyase family enzyme